MVIAKALAARNALNTARTGLLHSHDRDTNHDVITPARTRPSSVPAGALPVNSNDTSNHSTDATGTASNPPAESAQPTDDDVDNSAALQEHF
eukprot:2523223-Pleurochrysis_carterae.AAC.1